MLIDRDGNTYPTQSGIEKIEDGYELIKSWVVRLIRNEYGNKKVVAEEKFKYNPTKNQILWCLTRHKEASFAVVEEIFEIEDTLPFR